MIPEMTADQCLTVANNALGKSWTDYEQNVLANLVRLNWMIEDLHNNKIEKPILLSQDFRVLTGDTRLMAASFHSKIKCVPTLVTANSNFNLSNFIDIVNIGHLAKILNIASNDIILNGQDWIKHPLSWIEFAYPHTQNHMHDEQQRVRMISNYLSKQSKEFVFTREWLQTPIDWSTWDNLDGH
jgi:hypothetical protein